MARTRTWFAMGVGAALSYLFDPEQGRARRNQLVEQATAAVKRRNRAAGVTAGQDGQDDATQGTVRELHPTGTSSASAPETSLASETSLAPETSLPSEGPADDRAMSGSGLVAGTGDDRTLVDRVRSEALGGPEYSGETINVDAVEGVVTLRGQLASQDRIGDVVARVRTVAGVRDVVNLLHLPGTPAPYEPQP